MGGAYSIRISSGSSGSLRTRTVVAAYTALARAGPALAIAHAGSIAAWSEAITCTWVVRGDRPRRGSG